MKFFKNKLAVTVTVLSVSFLVLIGYSVKKENASFLQSGVGTLINPIQGFVYNINENIKEYTGFLFSFSKVKQENEELRKKNDDFEKMALEYDALKSQNDSLREMLNFKNQHLDYNYIGCDIIGKSGGSFLDLFIINRGSNDGIQKRMIVITSKGVIGQVTYVASNWAEVQSLANENIAIGAMTTENEGIVKGFKDSNNNLLAKLYNLPSESTVKKGDVVVTSGSGGVYPKGIRIGYVLEVEEDKVKLMKNALIQPYINYNKIEEVFVVVPKDKREIKY